MKTFASFLLCVLALTGCSFSAMQRGEVKAVNSRWFWSTEGFELDVETNGTARLRLQKSNPDAESIGAAAKGAAEGTARGLKGF